MANSLLEAYKKRLNISESVYSRAHNGDKMDTNRKLVVAKCLQNLNNFMNESFDGSMATQRQDLGLYKKFCLNLTTVALPNLVAHDLVIVHPMSSMSGYVAYLQYTTGTAKGDVESNTFLRDPFKQGDAVPSYTSSTVVDPITSVSADMVPTWGPVVKGAFTDGSGAAKDVKIVDSKGAVTYADLTAEGKVPQAALKENGKVAYLYDNIVIPQDKLPTIKAEMKSIPLIAKARRLAIYFSQIAAFQAKTDYGFDLGDSLAEQAVGELQYEVDTEIINLLDETAGEAQANLIWSKTLPVGVAKTEHYEGFSEVVEIARSIIYNRTKKFAPNYMVIAADVLPILTFIKGWTAAPAGQVNGPYMAGTLNSLKVFVSPSMASGEYLIGVNGNDMLSSVAVYAPYMAILPTSLLQFADGTTSQGFSTLYDLKVLNKDLIVKGKVVA